MKRLLVHLGVFGAGGVLWLGASRLPRPVPKPPPAQSDARVTERKIAFLEARAAADPQGATGFAFLAAAYLARFGETGDSADIVRAELAARHSIAIRSQNNGGAYLTLAHALLNQHRFAEAKAAAAKLPLDNSGAAALVAESQLELGQYDAALKTLSLAQAASPEDPFLKTLRARLFDIDGDSERALVTYRRALEGAENLGTLSAGTLAWFHGRIAACLALQGKTDESEAAWEEALALAPRDWRAMSALGKVLACRGDWDGAAHWARRSWDVTPTPEAAMLLADAALSRGDKMDTDLWMGRIIESQTGAHQHGRALALFLADHELRTAEALKLAEADAKSRPDIYSFDALGWCLFRAGKLPEAAQAAKKSLARGTRDANLLYHAGRIQLALGNTAEGRRLLGDALALSPDFHPTQAAVARKLLGK